MKRRILLLAAFVPFGLWSVAVSDSDKALTVKELDDEIRRSLPPGALQGRVIAFLQEHKIPYHDSRAIAYFKGPRTVWGLLAKSTGNRLLIVDTILTFEFDAEDKLISYSSREQLVGP